MHQINLVEDNIPTFQEMDPFARICFPEFQELRYVAIHLSRHHDLQHTQYTTFYNTRFNIIYPGSAIRHAAIINSPSSSKVADTFNRELGIKKNDALHPNSNIICHESSTQSHAT